jgi:hypothetical protein
MHFCTAFIAIANDEQQVAYRGPYDPISWPEIEVLRTLHGDEAVRNVKPFVYVEQDAKAEQQRLLLIYGTVVTEQVFRGRKPLIEMDAAEMDVLEPGTMWMNPITKEVALVPEAAEEVDVEDDEPDAPAESREVRAARRAEKKRLYNMELRRKEREAKAAAAGSAGRSFAAAPEPANAD